LSCWSEAKHLREGWGRIDQGLASPALRFFVVPIRRKKVLGLLQNDIQGEELLRFTP
jgi:hypothetical protein